MFKKYFMMVTVVIMVLMASVTTFAGVKKFGKYNRKAFEERMLERLIEYRGYVEWKEVESELEPDTINFVCEVKKGDIEAVRFHDDAIIINRIDNEQLIMTDLDVISMTEKDYDDLYKGNMSIWKFRCYR